MVTVVLFPLSVMKYFISQHTKKKSFEVWVKTSQYLLNSFSSFVKVVPDTKQHGASDP